MVATMLASAALRQSVKAHLAPALRAEGFEVRRDTPFGGALVPLERYRRDARVHAVMIEVRRDLYCDASTGQLLPDWAGVARRLERACLVAGVIGGSDAP